MAYRQNYLSNNYADNNQKLGYSSVSKNYGGYNQGYSQRSIIFLIKISHRITTLDKLSLCWKTNGKSLNRQRRNSTTTWTTKGKPEYSSKTS